MKALVFVTYADCDNKVKSLEAAGYEVETFQYDKLKHDDHWLLIERAKHSNADFAVFIGAQDGPNHNVPQTNILRTIKDFIPLILMCNDAADAPWWDTLNMYQAAGCFDLQVAIDGADSPIKQMQKGLTLLTPIDTRPYKPKPWNERTTFMGMSSNDVGGWHRGDMVRCLRERGDLVFRKGTAETFSYENYAEFMCNTKVVFNHPQTGSAKYFHVKGRVVEAGFAGCCLLERRGSPTSRWFEPGTDYIEYAGDSVQDVYDALRINSHRLKQTALNLQAKVRRLHNPSMFWSTVLQRTALI